MKSHIKCLFHYVTPCQSKLYPRNVVKYYIYRRKITWHNNRYLLCFYYGIRESVVLLKVDDTIWFGTATRKKIRLWLFLNKLQTYVRFCIHSLAFRFPINKFTSKYCKSVSLRKKVAIWKVLK